MRMEKRTSETSPPANRPKFPTALLGEHGKNGSVKERLEEYFFRYGRFDIAYSALSLPGVQARHTTNAKSMKGLWRGGRKKIEKALREMVDLGEITLRSLIDNGHVTPQALPGYWSDIQNCRFWLDEAADEWMNNAIKAKSVRHGVNRAKNALKKRLSGEPLGFFDNLVYLEFKREAICNVLGGSLRRMGLASFWNTWGGKPFEIASALYPEFGIKMWEVGCERLAEHFSDEKNQSDAMRWLVLQFNKKFRDFTVKEAALYEKSQTSPASMSPQEWRAFEKINPKRARDPITLNDRNLIAKRLKSLLFSVPSPDRVEKLVLLSFKELGYTHEDFCAFRHQRKLENVKGRTESNEEKIRAYERFKKQREEVFRLQKKLKAKIKYVEEKLSLMQKAETLQAWEKSLAEEQQRLGEMRAGIMEMQRHAILDGHFFVLSSALRMNNVFHLLTEQDQELLLSTKKQDWHIGKLNERSKARIRSHIIESAFSSGWEEFVKKGAVMLYFQDEPAAKQKWRAETP